jgi:hypothetical protein
MKKIKNVLAKITSSSNFIRRLIIGVLLTIFVSCYLIVIIEFEQDLFIQVLAAIIMLSVLWLIIKVDNMLLNEINKK